MNILKKTILVVIILFSVANAHSQESKFSIGAKAGINLSNVDMDHVDTDSKIGYQFGIVAEYDLQKNFFLRSGLDVTSKGLKLDIEGAEDFNGDGLMDYIKVKSTWNAVYLQLPLMLGYNVDITNNFKINFAVGAYLGYGIGGKVSSKISGSLGAPSGPGVPFATKSKENTFSDDFLKRFDTGLLGSIGAECKSFTLSLGYEYGLSNITTTGGPSIYNRNAFVTVGYKLY